MLRVSVVHSQIRRLQLGSQTGPSMSLYFVDAAVVHRKAEVLSLIMLCDIVALLNPRLSLAIPMPLLERMQYLIVCLKRNRHIVA